MIHTWLHFGIRNSARQPLLFSDGGCLCCGYGSRCEDRVCPAMKAGYDHFSAIRSVFDAPLPVSRETVRSGEYNSILITLVRATLHPLFFPGKLLLLLFGQPLGF
jgi:hypothetical protein